MLWRKKSLLLTFQNREGKSLGLKIKVICSLIWDICLYHEKARQIVMLEVNF